MPDSKFVYLASQSPRRRQLLEQLGVRYELLLPDHSHVFAYLRDDGVRRVLVLCNFSGQTQSLSCSQLPDLKGSIALISNLPDLTWSDSQNQLQPWEASAYCLATWPAPVED